MERKVQWKRCSRVLQAGQEGPGRHEEGIKVEDSAESMLVQ